jgi:hypothetical protein
LKDRISAQIRKIQVGGRVGWNVIPANDHFVIGLTDPTDCLYFAIRLRWLDQQGVRNDVVDMLPGLSDSTIERLRSDAAALPQDTINNNQVNRYYHLENLETMLALFRGDKTLYILWAGSGPTFENGIQTAQQILGT